MLKDVMHFAMSYQLVMPANSLYHESMSLICRMPRSSKSSAFLVDNQLSAAVLKHKLRRVMIYTSTDNESLRHEILCFYSAIQTKQCSKVKVGYWMVELSVILDRGSPRYIHNVTLQKPWIHIQISKCSKLMNVLIRI